MLPKAALGFFLLSMTKLIVDISKLLILLALALFVSAKPVHAQDERVLKLSHYLKTRNSILAPHAQTFVDEADKNGFDYRLIPAISGVESTFGRFHLQGSHNYYGWGGGRIYFESNDDGIAKISKGLKKGYMDKGAKTVLAISYIYCPPNHFKWYNGVTQFMNEIEAVDVSKALASQQLALSSHCVLSSSINTFAVKCIILR